MSNITYKIDLSIKAFFYHLVSERKRHYEIPSVTERQEGCIEMTYL